jgi:predicted nucleic acid-binding protein
MTSTSTFATGTDLVTNPRVFADTSGWVSIVDKSDKYHFEVAKTFREFQEKRIRILTSDYVLDESVTHLLNATGHRSAVDFGRWILQSAQVEVARVDEDIWEAAWEMFQAYEDKEWSFTDCTSFVLMQRRQLYLAFSFDHHFEQAGFQLWPAQG